MTANLVAFVLAALLERSRPVEFLTPLSLQGSGTPSPRPLQILSSAVVCLAAGRNQIEAF